MDSGYTLGAMTYPPIEDHGIIGNLHTAALVGLDATIRFLCLPRFDSPTIFAALLDEQRGGRFQIAPVFAKAKTKQSYLPDSNILVSRFLSEDGLAEISDFMPVEPGLPWSRIVRRAKTIRGEVRYRLVCSPRFNYGRSPHRAEHRGGEVIFVSRGGDRTAVRLYSSVPLRIRQGDVDTEFVLRSGESATCILEEARDVASPATGDGYATEAFKRTLNFWRRWIAQTTYRGRWREMVVRSALVLKLLTSKVYGSIVAAPTFGLPEHLGGERNWDYRYTWIRDGSFAVNALMRIGLTEEAAAFIQWVDARCGERRRDGSLQVMYGIDGRHDLTERVLRGLEGYMRSAPVRIGNAAYRQVQHDIYGELMDVVATYNRVGELISDEFWENLVPLMMWVCSHWRRKGEGIWEVRGGPQEFLYSRLMCWVALDRALRLARERSFPAPRGRWRAARDAIYGDIFRSFWNEERQSFIQSKRHTALDATALLMPLERFISPSDPRWQSTLQAIGTDLTDDSLVHRYRQNGAAPDGLPGTEGTFSMCTFWYVSSLARSGDVQLARLLFEKMLGYANHLGLYAEQLGSQGEQLGNFPQAFTHAAMIRAAVDLDRLLDLAWSRAR
jgi:GH15 family glucan-1,4-alpha-glucosidase